MPSRSKWVLLGFVCLGGSLASREPAWAISERFQDLPASVDVAQVFGLDVTRSSLTFENAQPGRDTVIGSGGSLNQVTCRSNTGRSWYLKAQVRSLTHLQQAIDLPTGSLKWRVTSSTGQGEISQRDFRGFSDEAAVIYAAAGDDLRGRQVALSFEYSLTVPSNAPAGTYVGQLVFTMVENL